MEEVTATPTREAAGGAAANGHPDGPRWPRRTPEGFAGGIVTVELTDHQKARAADVIDQQFLETVSAHGIAPGTSEFYDAAEILEGVLPERARAAIAAMRRSELAAVVVRNLPADPDPGPTPAEPGLAPTTPVRGHTFLAMAVRRMGHEFAYQMEKKGALVHNIYPTGEGAKTQSNASFEVDLSLHTENAFHPIRPDYVTLYCIRTVAEAPATRLVLLDEILDQLTDHEISVLRQERFTIRVVDSHKAEGEADIELPITPLTGSPRRPVIRWHETLRANDDVAAKVCRAFAEAAQAATRYVKLHEGDMLCFANELALHGRDKFDARLDGTDRWLIRGYSLRDLTSTAPYVSPARPRVTRVDLAAGPTAA